MNPIVIGLLVIGVLALALIGVLVDRWIETKMNERYNIGEYDGSK